MGKRTTASIGMLSASFAALLCAASATDAAAQPAAGAQVRIDADDIGGVVSFLAGPNSGWVNGQIIRANGGVI